MTSDLKPNQRLYLISLVASSGSQLFKDRTVDIKAPDRRNLESARFIETGEREGGSFRIELTDKGWARVRDEMTALPPPGSASKTLYAVLKCLKAYLDRNRLSLADMFSEAPVPSTSDFRSRVLAAYDSEAGSAGAWVSLTTIRSCLSQVARGDIDPALETLAREGRILLAPNDNTASLSRADHEAALFFGGEQKHQFRRLGT